MNNFNKNIRFQIWSVVWTSVIITFSYFMVNELLEITRDKILDESEIYEIRIHFCEGHAKPICIFKADK